MSINKNDNLPSLKAKLDFNSNEPQHFNVPGMAMIPSPILPPVQLSAVATESPDAYNISPISLLIILLSNPILFLF